MRRHRALPRDHNDVLDVKGTHLHSHPRGMPEAKSHDEVDLLAETFVTGYEKADDKIGFLRLSGIPFELPDPCGGPSLKLVEVHRLDCDQVGSASPGFGSRELVHHPFTGDMVGRRTEISFVFVSMEERRVVPIRALLAGRQPA